ncbi:hypothetical protein OKW96_11820 [Sphingobacterium sp. KU25419]|nr:hypothetical protein OKW96_11820 [Sphingobacterium sp. KU25419]
MSFFYKKKLIECIAPVTEEIIGFIEQNEVDLYFYLQLINKNVTKEDLIERFTNSSEEKRHFIFGKQVNF